MKFTFILVFCLLFFPLSNVKAQTDFKIIEKQVLENNRNNKQEEAFRKLLDYLNDDEISNFDKYQAYLLKATIHKSLFDYDDTFKSINLAEKFGLKSDRIDEVKANILAERALAYFDIQKYDKAKSLMQRLRASNYAHLEGATTAMLVMQEGYLDLKIKQFKTAEQKFDEAILLMQKFDIQNLPIVYGKKIELYKLTKEQNKVQQEFKLGLQSAQKSKLVKYQIYMYEQLREQQMSVNDWKSAFKSYQIIDQLKTNYDAEESNNKLNLLEKNIEIQRKDFELERSIIFRNYLIAFSLVLVVGLYLAIRLYKSNKQKSILLDKEYKRIHDELEILTKELTNQGITKVNFEKYNLTQRQLEIIELIRKGKSNKEIATLLFLSENTVKYHLKAIYDILKIENRSEFLKLIN